MHKSARRAVFLSSIGMVAAAFLYMKALGDGVGSTRTAIAVYLGLGSGVVFLLGLVLMLLTAQDVEMEDEDEGLYDPYGDPEPERVDEYAR
ncbi:MAG: hypothetical protein ACYTGJ_03815 [Planctomycetota bacterium]|jgi:hypothetical protein